MGSITFSKFDLGIDLRKGGSVSDANRLRDMKNAFVTTGLATQKRPGLTHVATLEPGTKGLFGGGGKLNTFHGTALITHANPLFLSWQAKYGLTEMAITKISYAEMYAGYPYIVATWANNVTAHSWLDAGVGGNKMITDINCPSGPAVIKMASKIFGVSPFGDVVRYCATNNPRDWTTVNDAGFLPTGLNATGEREAKALGKYQNKLVVLHRDAAQVWTVDPDPSNMALDDIIENVGTSYPLSLATVGGDLFFLSDFGFRSITTSKLIDKKEDVDVGSPIDTLVKPAIAAMTGDPKAVYYYGTGQYIAALDDEMFVYSISRTAKIAAWSRYELPFAVDAITQLNGVLYLRTGDDVYQFDDTVSTDNGVEYEVLLELPYMDFKAPGQLKQIVGFDLVMEGECYFSLGFDARDTDAVTDEVRVQGNSRGGGIVPLECCGTEFSPRFRNQDGEPFRLDALTIYYNVLGPV